MNSAYWLASPFVWQIRHGNFGLEQMLHSLMSVDVVVLEMQPNALKQHTVFVTTNYENRVMTAIRMKALSCVTWFHSTSVYKMTTGLIEAMCSAHFPRHSRRIRQRLPRTRYGENLYSAYCPIVIACSVT